MMARATIPPMTPPTIAPVFEDVDEEFDPEEEERLGALDALVALKNPLTAGSSNLVLPPLQGSLA